MVVETTICFPFPFSPWTKGPATMCWNPKFKSAHPSMVMVDVIGSSNDACPNAKLNILYDPATGIPRWAINMKGSTNTKDARFLVVMAEGE